MNIFICDDDKNDLELTVNLVNQYFDSIKEEVNIRTFETGESLLKSDTEPDIAFLDVRISDGISGTHVGKKLKEKFPEVKIFIITSHIEYVNESFRFCFYRFFTKPLNKKLFFIELGDVVYQKATEKLTVAIEMYNGGLIIKTADIIAVEASGRGSKIYTKKETLESIQSITQLETLLSSTSFFRTHRKFIVGLRFVSSYDKRDVCLVYNDKPIVTAYLSLAKYKNFKDALAWFRERIL